MRSVGAVAAREPARTAKVRQRGPSVLQRRAAEQAAAEAADAASKRNRRTGSGRGRVRFRVAGAAGRVLYGRRRLHAVSKPAVDGAGNERRNALLDKGWCRRAVAVHGVAASGNAVFEDVPGREEYALDELGAQQHEEAFVEYVEGNFDDAGAESRSLDYRDRTGGPPAALLNNT